MSGLFRRLFSLLLILSILLPSVALAESNSLTITGKRAKIIGKAAMYGAGGGLVVGLASQVFKKKTKNIFLFGSLGMYAGILLGVYVISTSRGPTPYEGPDTYEDYGDFSLRKKILPESQLIAANELSPSDSLSIQFLNLKF